MRCLPALSLALLLLGSAAVAVAQDAVEEEATFRSPGQQTNVTVTQTPEMVFYQQERERYEDPKMMVRRRAELKGQQRAERLASQKWFGISNSRPTVSCTPGIGGSYAPYWGSNSYDPNRWRPYQPIVVVPNVMR